MLIVIVLVLILLIFGKFNEIDSEFSVDGGRRKAACAVAKPGKNIQVIGPNYFVFYPRTAKFPKMLLFGEYHDDKWPACKNNECNMEILEFTQRYIKRHPPVQILVEQPYKINPACKKQERFNVMKYNIKILMNMVKRDSKHYKAADNREVTKLCLLTGLSDDAPPKWANAAMKYATPLFEEKSYTKTVDKFIKIAFSTAQFKSKYSAITASDRKVIDTMINDLRAPGKQKKLMKIYKKCLTLDRYYLDHFVLDITAILNDIEMVMQIMAAYQKDKNVDIIVYFGSFHIDNMVQMLHKYYKMSPTIEIKSKKKNCISIPNMDRYF